MTGGGNTSKTGVFLSDVLNMMGNTAGASHGEDGAGTAAPWHLLALLSVLLSTHCLGAYSHYSHHRALPLRRDFISVYVGNASLRRVKLTKAPGKPCFSKEKEKEKKLRRHFLPLSLLDGYRDEHSQRWASSFCIRTTSWALALICCRNPKVGHSSGTPEQSEPKQPPRISLARS